MTAQESVLSQSLRSERRDDLRVVRFEKYADEAELVPPLENIRDAVPALPRRATWFTSFQTLPSIASIRFDLCNLWLTGSKERQRADCLLRISDFRVVRVFRGQSVS
jgi:hypothetical protein